MLFALSLLTHLLLNDAALAQRTTSLITPRQTLSIESETERNGRTIQWQRAVTTESGRTFRYTTDATFDGSGGVSGQITGERTSATFEGTTQRDGNTLSHQRTIETEQGRRYQINSAIEFNGLGSFQGQRSRSNALGQVRSLEFSGTRQR